MNEFIKSDSLHAKVNHNLIYIIITNLIWLFVKVNNLTLLEINTVRNLLTKTLKELYNLKQNVQTNDEW